MLTTLFKHYINLNPAELSKEQILNLEHEFKHPNPDTISDEFLDFKLWSIGYPSRQETFAKYLAKQLPSKAKLLEVGCGKNAKLSRLLTEMGFCVTAIDSKLELLNYTKLTPLKASFNKDFDVSKYDFVIAQEPCEATEHVVRACTVQGIPFIMSLCGVPHKLISGQMPKSTEDWYKYLTNLDKNIKIRYIRLDPFSVTVILKNF